MSDSHLLTRQCALGESQPPQSYQRHDDDSVLTTISILHGCVCVYACQCVCVVYLSVCEYEYVYMRMCV